MEVVYFSVSICIHIYVGGGRGWVMVVVDGVYICCYAEGKESRRGSTYFLLSYLYYFKTYYRSR